MSDFDYSKLSEPEFFEENRLSAHSDHMTSATRREALEEKSSLRLSLNGLWKFTYSPTPALAPANFQDMSVDCHTWGDIRVPAHLEMEGYGVPQYVNTQYPWDGHEDIDPPEVPEKYNPTGNYVRYFTLPDGFIQNGLFLRLDGVESAAVVWLNGHYVGYSSDTFDAKEFELTPYVTSGENKLALQVFRFNAGSWMEDQDFYRFSGIFRSVTLFTYARADVRDLKVVTALSNQYRQGTLEFTLKTTGSGTARLSLVRQKADPVLDRWTDDGEALAYTEVKITDGAGDNASAPEDNVSVPEITGRFAIEDPALWSAEEPNLYALWIELLDADGRSCGFIRQDIGFREFTLGDDHIMRINGRRIVFNGVDRHEFSSLFGRAITEKEMLTDILNFKRHNINALRMSHYPNNTAMYRLCDRYGIYVMDENNLETHGTWDAYLHGAKDMDYVIPGDHPQWLPMLLDRGKSMYERDKNHPAVLIWSCGNESFGGRDFLELSRYFHREDPARLVHYEGVTRDRRYNETSDIESHMYPPVEEIRDYLKEHRDKPYICCEYAHAMGNSNGGMFKYTDLTEEDPLYQGGFIWDYIDQCIALKDRYGKPYSGYGGDCGERPTDYDFCGNGIAFGDADRTPSPKMAGVKYLYQPYRITVNAAADSCHIKSRRLFRDTSDLITRIEIHRYGKLVTCHSFEPEIRAGEEIQFGLGIGEFLAGDPEPGEYTVTVSMLLKEKTMYADAGFEMAFGQDVFRQGLDEYNRVTGSRAMAEEAGNEAEGCGRFIPQGLFTRTSDERLTLAAVRPYIYTAGKYNIGVRGEHFEALFSMLSGAMTSYVYGGRQMLKAPVKPNFWRAPTENDYGNGMPQQSAQWKIASLYVTHKKDVYTKYEHFMEPLPMHWADRKTCVQVEFAYRMPTVPASSCRMIYQVYGDGTVEMEVSMDSIPKEMGLLPEFGVIGKLDADYNQLTWYGPGPEETYIDRMAGSRVGLYRAKVTDQLTPYLLPQEAGNHEKVRYAAVTDEKGRGLLFAADTSGGMNFSALPWTPHEIENAAHSFELPPVHYTVFRASLGQLGIAGDNSWGAETHPEFRIPTDKPLTFRVLFRGI